MARKAPAVALVVALVSAPLPMGAQAPDPEVAKGVALVDDGDYDAAILSLDAAARRLAKDPQRTKDLSQAYLYLGIAYMGKGHEAAAKAKFKEAVAQIKDLTLSPDKFPPKVINAFEAAKAEAGQAQTAAAAPPTAPPAEKKKGGGGKAILIIGGVAAAAGVAVAAGGGSSSSGPTTTTTTLPARNRQEFAGTLTGYETRGYQIVATRSGTLEAQVTWQDGQLELVLACQEHDPPYTACGTYNRTTNTTGTLTASVTQKTYDILVQNFMPRPQSYTLVVLHP
ncbi:MAG TPA: hypothetical protein VFM88_03320 [Vicinamibacteria bacterium]|nr:hypothetical protein [Vicinamibacteria bacterium]